MPQTDFYNLNRFIAYPLKERETSLYPFGAYSMRESALVDAGFVLGIDAAYDQDYRVKLIRLERLGTTVTFVFQDEAGTATFRFEFDVSAAPGTIVEAAASEGLEFGSGFVVAGLLSVLGAEIPAGVYDAAEAFYVEEGVVQSLYQHYVKQFTIASQPDTPWHAPTECGGSPADIWNYQVTGRDLRGHRRFKPGYNATISVIELDNAIEIGAGDGAGEGEPCGRVPLEPESSLSSESMSSLLSMSSELAPLRCKDVFNTVNGITPSALGDFSLLALSTGIAITPLPAEHKIIVDFLTGANSPFCLEDMYGSSSLSL